MRTLWVLLTLVLAGIVWAQQPLIYTALVTDVSPEVRAGRTFVPIRAIAEQFGATVQWQPATRIVLIQRANQPTIQLVIGSTTVRVDGRTVILDAAPFISQGRTMIPLRFIAETYGVPVSYHEPTRTVRLQREGRLFILPLISSRGGVVIETPTPNQVVSSPILVQGVANVFEGHLDIEVRNAAGTVLSRTFTTAGMGGFYPFSVQVAYNNPTGAIIDGRIFAISQNGRGDSQIIAQDSVAVRLSPTNPPVGE
jgi:hypothetical protein